MTKGLEPKSDVAACPLHDGAVYDEHRKMNLVRQDRNYRQPLSPYSKTVYRQSTAPCRRPYGDLHRRLRRSGARRRCEQSAKEKQQASEPNSKARDQPSHPVGFRHLAARG
jgi:hypothetical protein